jgi:hypothetical protein
MNAHITDEELLSVMDGRAAAHVSSHLVHCEDCWNEAHRLNASIARFASNARFESARAEAATLRRPVRVRAVYPYLRWAIPVAAVLVLTALAMVSYHRPSAVVAGNTHQVPAASQTLQAQAKAAPARKVGRQVVKRQADDILLMQVQDDMDRELPTALQPIALIVPNEISTQKN